MKIVEVTQVTPVELVNLITEGIKDQLKDLSIKLNSDSTENLKPHLTRKETALFFNISLNCLNDWSNKGILKPYQVGNRIFFKREEILTVMFNRPKR